MMKLVYDMEIHETVILERIPGAQRFVWIATSDIKDLHVSKGRKVVPFLEILSDLLYTGVTVRLIHAKEPGPNFRRDFDRYPVLIEGLERLLCPRVHFKMAIIDGRFAYCGSANLTGAGMGAKSRKKRNFEAGFISDDPGIVESIMNRFDSVWMGRYCGDCARAQFCTERQEMV